jgi:hypothetical protein
MRADILLNKLNQRVIPALEREKEITFKERVLLGLKPDEANIRGGLWSYPKAMTKSRAYLTAIDSVGGDELTPLLDPVLI